MSHIKRFVDMKQIIEPVIGGYTACALALFLLHFEQGELMLTIGILLLMAYYLVLTIQGAVKGDLDPVLNHVVTSFTPASRAYNIAGLVFAFACFICSLTFFEGNTSILLMLISIALLIFALFRVDFLFHKTCDRRHLSMLYRLGIFSAVVLLAFVINF